MSEQLPALLASLLAPNASPDAIDITDENQNLHGGPDFLEVLQQGVESSAQDSTGNSAGGQRQELASDSGNNSPAVEEAGGFDLVSSMEAVPPAVLNPVARETGLSESFFAQNRAGFLQVVPGAGKATATVTTKALENLVTQDAKPHTQVMAHKLDTELFAAVKSLQAPPHMLNVSQHMPNHQVLSRATLTRPVTVTESKNLSNTQGAFFLDDMAFDLARENIKSHVDLHGPVFTQKGLLNPESVLGRNILAATGQSDGAETVSEAGEQKIAEQKLAPGLSPFSLSKGVSVLTQPLHHANWANALSERVVWHINQNINEAELKLTPSNLGSIEVRISMSGEEASINLSSPHLAVREVLEASIPRLREFMESTGLSLGDVNVSSEQGSKQQAQQDVAEKTAPGQTTLMSSSVEQVLKHQTSLGLVDLYA